MLLSVEGKKVSFKLDTGFVCLFVCGISLTSGQLVIELFPDWTLVVRLTFYRFTVVTVVKQNSYPPKQNLLGTLATVVSCTVKSFCTLNTNIGFTP